MKKNLFILLMVTGVGLLGSCKKENSTKSQSTGGLKVKTYTENIVSSSLGNLISTYNLGYDDSDRIISVTSATSAGDKFLFSYPSAGKYSVDIYNGNVLSIHSDAYTNIAGFIDSTFQYNNSRDFSSEK
ncbi:MAG: hypothetical protein JWR61_2409 [Ferruginibacter sp.]|jgi:hypothetical protein|uniref:hypothetical protein n=1 Tax=Ferruginibacter sp. TaxID=1940288 RepID=UPI00265B22A1|nr:hypothetical protein [Ferruginibacter sp.]MDB5277454.1 hypothetical protein [Ferruginibacter sp.]